MCDISLKQRLPRASHGSAPSSINKFNSHSILSIKFIKSKNNTYSSIDKFNSHSIVCLSIKFIKGKTTHVIQLINLIHIPKLIEEEGVVYLIGLDHGDGN